MTGSEWVDVGAEADLHGNPGVPVRLGDKFVALFHVDGRWHCLDNACPHAGAPLCDGTIRDGKVVCFLHCWEFDLATGQSDVGPEWNVATHRVRVVDGRVQIEQPPPR